MNCKLVGLCVLIVFIVYFSTTSFYLQAEDKAAGKIIFENKCDTCHPLLAALSKTKDLEQWKAVTLRMSKKKNSDIKPDEAEIIAEYLSQEQGK